MYCVPADGSFEGVDGTICGQDNQCNYNRCVNQVNGNPVTCLQSQPKCGNCFGANGHFDSSAKGSCRHHNENEMYCLDYSGWGSKCNERENAPHGAHCWYNYNCQSNWCATWGGAGFRAHCAGYPGQQCGWQAGLTTANMGTHCFGDTTTVEWCAGYSGGWFDPTYCENNYCVSQSGRRLEEASSDYASIYAAMFNVSVDVYLRGTMNASHAPDGTNVTFNFVPGPDFPPSAPPPSPPAPPPLACSQMQGRLNTQDVFGVEKFCYDVPTSAGCDLYYSLTYASSRMRLCYNSYTTNSSTTYCSQTEYVVCEGGAD